MQRSEVLAHKYKKFEQDLFSSFLKQQSGDVTRNPCWSIWNRLGASNTVAMISFVVPRTAEIAEQMLRDA